MSNDIEEKVRALFKYLKEDFDYEKNLDYVQEVVELKAALTPTREEIACYLENELVTNIHFSTALQDENNKYLKLAIKELRK